MKKISAENFLKSNKHLKPINNVNIDLELNTTEISRAGLAFLTNSKFFSPGRVQLLGAQDFEILETLEKEDIDNFFKNKMPVIIFSRNKEPDKYFIDTATKNNILVCKSNMGTAKVFYKTYQFLEGFLAEETQVHGVMLSIHGKGVLLQGASGIGKSEVALELIKRGHILISDDMVIFKKLDTNTLSGSSPELLRNRMEIRGIGIVDVQKLFGVTSVMLNSDLDLVINLVDSSKVVDRIGNGYLYDEILGVSKKRIDIPILSGKNIANLVEVAVANYQLVEDYNYNSSEEFLNDLNETLKKKGHDANNKEV